jgi:Holliday junction resolvase RusA-like endonuclease
VVTYSSSKDTSYADRIRWAWRQAGSVDFGQASLELSVTAVFARPKAHWLVSGELSSAGIFAGLHHRSSPDLSNIIKALEDALNRLAYVDDRQICSYGEARKVWTLTPDEAPRLEIALTSLEVGE